jgi:hypothetical protein
MTEIILFCVPAAAAAAAAACVQAKAEALKARSGPALTEQDEEMLAASQHRGRLVAKAGKKVGERAAKVEAQLKKMSEEKRLAHLAVSPAGTRLTRTAAPHTGVV